MLYFRRELAKPEKQKFLIILLKSSHHILGWLSIKSLVFCKNKSIHSIYCNQIFFIGIFFIEFFHQNHQNHQNLHCKNHQNRFLSRSWNYIFSKNIWDNSFYLFYKLNQSILLAHQINWKPSFVLIFFQFLDNIYYVQVHY